MSDLPILYSFRRCPYAMRARMALLISNTICEIREVVLAHKPVAMIAASPKGTVPVLVLPDGYVLDQSIDIMRWALAGNDPERWLQGDRGDCDALIATNDGPFKHHLDRYKYPDRYDADANMHRDAGFSILRGLEVRLESRSNLCRETRSLADMAIMPFVRQFAETDRAWFDALPLPSLQRWLQAHLASPLFAQAMVRLPAWQPGDAPTLFAIESR